MPSARVVSNGSSPVTVLTSTSSPNVHWGWLSVIPVTPKKSTTSSANMLEYTCSHRDHRCVVRLALPPDRAISSAGIRSRVPVSVPSSVPVSLLVSCIVVIVRPSGWRTGR